MKKGNALLYVILLLVIIITGGVFYIFYTKYKDTPGLFKCSNQCGNNVCDTSPCQSKDCPCSESEITCAQDCKKDTSTPDPYINWKKYRNEQHGFELSFPPDFVLATDEENLYGWPDGLALMYKGGQSYDLAIEYWETKEEYEQKYPNQNNLTVKQVKDGYVTFLNTNFDPVVDQIISTYINTSE